MTCINVLNQIGHLTDKNQTVKIAKCGETNIVKDCEVKFSPENKTMFLIGDDYYKSIPFSKIFHISTIETKKQNYIFITSVGSTGETLSFFVYI